MRICNLNVKLVLVKVVTKKLHDHGEGKKNKTLFLKKEQDFGSEGVSNISAFNISVTTAGFL